MLHCQRCQICLFDLDKKQATHHFLESRIQFQDLRIILLQMSFNETSSIYSKEWVQMFIPQNPMWIWLTLCLKELSDSSKRKDGCHTTWNSSKTSLRSQSIVNQLKYLKFLLISLEQKTMIWWWTRLFRFPISKWMKNVCLLWIKLSERLSKLSEIVWTRWWKHLQNWKELKTRLSSNKMSLKHWKNWMLTIYLISTQRWQMRMCN